LSERPAYYTLSGDEKKIINEKISEVLFREKIWSCPYYLLASLSLMTLEILI